MMKGRKRGEFGGKKGREKAVLTVDDWGLVGKIDGGDIGGDGFRWREKSFDI